MATELQKQVALLKSRNFQHQSLKDGKASIFLTAKEAAAVDVTTVFEAAITGLKALIQYDQRFEPFLTGLLHPSSVDIQRELKTKEENAELDTEIEKLLALLSLWAFEPNAHLVLEYLLRRFLIHEFNTDALIRCMLVAHDTKIFGRILHLCRLAETRWVFLSSFQSAGEPVPRNVLVKRIIKNAPWLIEVIANNALQALYLIGLRKGTSSTTSSLILKGAEKMISFVTAVVVEVADQIAFDDSKMRTIYVFLLEGLKISNNVIFTAEQSKLLLDWKCSCCVMISQLSRKTTFASSLQRVLGNAFAEYLKKSSAFPTDLEMVLLQSAFATLSILSDHGSLDLSPKLVQELIRMERKESISEDEPSAYSSLLMEYLHSINGSSLPTRLFGKVVELLTVVEEKSEEGVPFPDLELLFISLSKQEFLSSQVLAHHLQILLIAATRIEDDHHHSPQYITMKNCIRAISNRHTRVFDEVVTTLYQASQQSPSLLESASTDHSTGSSNQSNLSATFDPQFSQRFTAFLTHVLNTDNYTASVASSESLFLALQHPVRQIRLEAIKKLTSYPLQDKEDTPETQSLVQLLITMLEDIDSEIAITVWQREIITFILKFIDIEKFFTIVKTTLLWWLEHCNEVNQDIHFIVLSKLLHVLHHETIFPLVFTNESNQVWMTQFILALGTGPLQVFNITISENVSKGFTKVMKYSYELFKQMLNITMKEKDKSNKDYRVLMHTKFVDYASKHANYVHTLLRSAVQETSAFLRISLLSLVLGLTSLPKDYKETEVTNIHYSILTLLRSLIQEYSQDSELYQASILNLLPKYFSFTRQNISVVTTSNGHKGKHPTPSTVQALINDRFMTDDQLAQQNESYQMLFAHLQLFIDICVSSDMKLMEYLDESLLTTSLVNKRQENNYLFYLLQLIAHPTFLRVLVPSISNEEQRMIEVISFQILLLSIQSIIQQKTHHRSSTITKGKSSTEDATHSSEENLLLLVLIPLLLWGASHSYAKIRAITIKCCEFIVAVAGLEGEESLDATTIISWTDLKLLCGAMIQKSKLILSTFEAVLGITINAAVKSSANSTFSLSLWKITTALFHNYRYYQGLIHPLLQFLPNLEVVAKEEQSDSYLFQLLRLSATQYDSLDTTSRSIIPTAMKLFQGSYRKQQTSNMNPKALLPYLQFIEEVMKTNSATSNTEEGYSLLKSAMLQFIRNGYLVNTPMNLTRNLVKLLFEQYLTTSASSAYLEALSSLGLEDEQIVHELQLTEQSLEKIVTTKVSEEMIVDERSEVIQKIIFILEAYLRSSNNASSTSNGSAAGTTTTAITRELPRYNASNRSLLKSFFHLLRIFGDVMKRWGSSFDYVSSLIVEGIALLVQSFSEQKVLFEALPATTQTPAKKGGRTRANSLSSVSSNHYYSHSDEALQDCRLLLSVFQSVKLYQFQSRTFKVLLLVVASLDESKAIELLSDCALLTAQFTEIVAIEKYLENLYQLRQVYLSRFTKEEEKVRQATTSLQLICQSLFSTTFIEASTNDRQQILRVFLKLYSTNTTNSEKAEQIAFTSAYNTIIAQTIASYEMNLHSSVSQSSSTTESQQKIDTIVLSRAAQRRAKRAITASIPEQLYQLSQFLFFHMSMEQQLLILSNLISTAQQYFLVAVNSANGQSSAITTNTSTITNSTFINQSLQYLSQQLLSTAMETEAETGTVKNIENGEEYAATFAMIYLEFLLEILENKKFHRNLVKWIQHASSSSSSVTKNKSKINLNTILQQQLLELADNFLQYMVIIESMKQRYGPLQDVEKITLRLEKEQYIISKYAISEVMFEGCLNCIQGFHSLLDTPSFISIIQELLNHDLLAVRQRAIVILKDRLQLTSGEKTSAAELQLYYDLFQRMEAITANYLKPLIESSTIQEVSEQIPLVQSAIMCADLLLQFMGKTSVWKTEILSFGDLLIGSIPIFYHSSITDKKSLQEMTPLLLDQKKLLGSILLCIATIFRNVGPSLLNKLPHVMKHLLHIYSTELTYWTPINSMKKLKLLPEMKSQLLFYRSVILAWTMITSAMANFIHSFLSELLPLLFQTFTSVRFQESESTNNEYEVTIYTDIHHCLQTILSQVPMRLLVPLLSKLIPKIYSFGYAASIHFVQWIQELVEQADRTIIMNTLPQWIMISSDLLEYRLQVATTTITTTTKEIDEIEAITSLIVTDISLKLTEKELKAFILRLLDWKNREGQAVEGEEDANSVDVIRTTKKGIAFYTVVNELVQKLKVLFNSTMGLLWDDYQESMNQMKESIDALMEKGSEGSSKKRKKLKELRNDLSISDNQLLDHYEKFNTVLFTLIQSLGDYGHGTFVNETRYEILYPLVLQYIPLREIFRTDDYYLHFQREILTPTLVQLCLSVQKDLLWKPLNYQLLLQTRHQLAIVRKSVIIMIGKLFQEVGDDYLHLLPECIQFISELLEDSNSDVVAATRETINIIEDLSGEKLESYLAH